MLISFKKALTFVLGIFLLVNGYAQQKAPTVTLTSQKGKKIVFKVKTQKIEWINGKLNLSFLSADGKLLQLNNIDESTLKDTIFRSTDVNAVYITDSISYKSIKRIAPLLEMTCATPKKGQEISILAQGSVFYKKNTIKYTIRYKGVLPEKRYNTTYKKKN
ncbi:MAG: hypothetical protein EAY81_06910 [Bacteroidetes bacterium]|nr:MAG: hypothetical protein EAY81_06910 [Bacteroidota bacterium]